MEIYGGRIALHVRSKFQNALFIQCSRPVSYKFNVGPWLSLMLPFRNKTSRRGILFRIISVYLLLQLLLNALFSYSGRGISAILISSVSFVSLVSAK